MYPQPATSAPVLGVELTPMATLPAAAKASPVAVSADDYRMVLNAVQQLGDQVAKRLDSQVGYCISPASIAAIVGMILLGVSESDKKGYLERLGLQSLSEAVVHQGLAQIVNSLASSSPVATVSVANAIAVKGTVSPDYLALFESVYKGKPFFLQTGSEEEQVNNWVKEQTDGKIPNLLAPGSLADHTLSCVLLNALSFFAEWPTKFDQAYPGFFSFPEGTCEAMMMSKKLEFNYKKTADCTLVELPFKTTLGHTHTFVAVMPEPDVSTRFFSSDYIKSLRKDAAELSDTRLVMPKLDVKFKLETLKEVFQSIGFPINAYLESLDPHSRVTKVLHETRLKVDEEGAFCAAATAAITTKGIGFSVQLNRPFAFYIMDGDTPIFQGVVGKEFLVSQEQNQKLLQEASIPKPEKVTVVKFSEAQVKQFLDQDKDVKLILPGLIEQVTARLPTVSQITTGRTTFTIVNYTDAQISCDKTGDRPSHPFVFTINGKRFHRPGFSPESGQFVFYPSTAGGYPGNEEGVVSSINKDDGQPASRIQVVTWNGKTGRASY